MKLFCAYRVPSGYDEIIKTVFKDVGKQFEGDTKAEIKQLKAERSKFIEMKEKAEDSFFSGDIDADSYKLVTIGTPRR